MFNKFNRNKAQTTLEYAILIGVIIAGLIAMQVYLKRGYQGQLKESADSMGKQFSPGYTTNSFTTINHTVSTETVAKKLTTSVIKSPKDQTSTKTGTENVQASKNEFWWK